MLDLPCQWWNTAEMCCIQSWKDFVALLLPVEDSSQERCAATPKHRESAPSAHTYTLAAASRGVRTPEQQGAVHLRSVKTVLRKGGMWQSAHWRFLEGLPSLPSQCLLSGLTPIPASCWGSPWEVELVLQVPRALLLVGKTGIEIPAASCGLAPLQPLQPCEEEWPRT